MQFLNDAYRFRFVFYLDNPLNFFNKIFPIPAWFEIYIFLILNFFQRQKVALQTVGHSKQRILKQHPITDLSYFILFYPKPIPTQIKRDAIPNLEMCIPFFMYNGLPIR